MSMTQSLFAAAALLLVAPALALADETSAKTEVSDQKPDAQPARPGCLQETGSRIRPRDGGCNSEPGRSYTRDELESTGSVTIGDALRRLDPAITSR